MRIEPSTSQGYRGRISLQGPRKSWDRIKCKSSRPPGNCPVSGCISLVLGLGPSPLSWPWVAHFLYTGPWFLLPVRPKLTHNMLLSSSGHDAGPSSLRTTNQGDSLLAPLGRSSGNGVPHTPLSKFWVASGPPSDSCLPGGPIWNLSKQQLLILENGDEDGDLDKGYRSPSYTLHWHHHCLHPIPSPRPDFSN